MDCGFVAIGSQAVGTARSIQDILILNRTNAPAHDRILMSNRTSNSHKARHWHTPALAALVVAGFVASVIAYFCQPSILGFVDAQGQPVSRIVDFFQIFLIEQLFDSMTGNGRFETGLLERIPLFLGALSWLAIAWWLGRPLVHFALLGTSASQLEKSVLAVLSGLAVLSTATLLVGLSGGLGSRWPLIGLIAVMCLAAWAGSARANNASKLAMTDISNLTRLTANDSTAEWIQPTSSLAVWLLRLVPVLTACSCALYVLGCLMPPWEFDVVEYHLQAPKEFMQAGRIALNDHNVYANMPLAAEMHSLASMTMIGGTDGWWWGGIMGKAITGYHSLMAAFLLGGFMGRNYGQWCGWIAAGLMLAAPGNAHVAMAGLIDMVLATYLLAALIVLVLIWPKLQSGSSNFYSVLLVSQLAGMAAACKYTGLIFVCLPLLSSLFVCLIRSHQRAAIAKASLACLLGLCITCVPWYAKNVWQTGNPFFPLAHSLLGGTELTEAQAIQWQNAHRVPVPNGGSAFSLSTLVQSANQVLLKSSFLPPGLVFLSLVGLVSCRFRSRLPATGWTWGWCGLALWILAIWWLATHRIDRFWLPILPVACAMAALGAAWIAQRLSTGLAASFTLLPLLVGNFFSASGAMGDNRFFVSLHSLREDAGTEELPGRISPAIGWANQNLIEDGARILLIGEAKVFDFRAPIVYATCFNTNPAEGWLRGQSVEAQRANLRTAGITHVMVNWSEIARYRSVGNYGFSDWPQPEDIDALVQNGVLRPMPTPLESSQVAVLAVQP